ncbi:MAG TPA: hypothetical protein VG297_21960 [Bryobacteraceae bacterium]|jgi:hypothetical protein|nr:hypothetical protein [Bryobacteraceae bacterium]
MKVRSNSSISSPSGAGAPAVRTAGPPAQSPDGVQISVASAGLDQTTKINELTAAVGAGGYETSSTATSHALVEDALSEGI